MAINILIEIYIFDIFIDNSRHRKGGKKKPKHDLYPMLMNQNEFTYVSVIVHRQMSLTGNG